MKLIVKQHYSFMYDSIYTLNVDLCLLGGETLVVRKSESIKVSQKLFYGALSNSGETLLSDLVNNIEELESGDYDLNFTVKMTFIRELGEVVFGDIVFNGSCTKMETWDEICRLQWLIEESLS